MRGGGRSTACRTLLMKDQKGSGESLVMWYAWGGGGGWSQVEDGTRACVYNDTELL